MKKISMLIASALILLNLQAYTQTWTVLSSGTSEGLYSIYAITTSEVHATGNNGIMLKSSNQGTSWTSQTNGTCNLRTVFFSSPTTGFIGGGCPSTFTACIYKTTTSGTSWTSQSSTTPPNLYSIYFPNATTGYAVSGGHAGACLGYTILKSIDGGNTWTVQNQGNTSALFSVFFTDVNNGCAVGCDGLIQKTTNGGTTWNTQTSGTTNNLTSVYFADSNTGYAVGNSGTVLKTTNGGTSWTLIPIIGFTTNLNSVYFFNANHGMAVGDNGAIIETDDGGITWTQYLGITTQSLMSIHFLNQNLGYACGSNGTILKYTSAIGVNEIENVTVCNAFPNPANDQLTIDFSGKNISNVTIALCNEPGQNVFEMEENIQFNHYTKTIDTKALANGIYFISVLTEKSKWTKKISINH